MSPVKPKLLVVDDNLDILDLVEVFLYKDYDVNTAGNGFEGLKIAKRELPDIIITDIMMPVMDGVRFFNDLRKTQETSSIPVVAMTSFLKQITRKSLLNMGFNGVVSKPLDRERLLNIVKSILSHESFSPSVQVTDETAT